MKEESTLILNATQIDQKITRIAHHIYENHYKEKKLYLVGIAERGLVLAKKIEDILEDISPLEITTTGLNINKDKPSSETINTTDGLKEIKNRVVILIDDVLNSGRTLVYAMKYLLDAEPKNIAIVTLIDRSYRRFPIHADYAGLTLSTNLKQHVRVELTRGKEAVYLDDLEI